MILTKQEIVTMILKLKIVKRKLEIQLEILIFKIFQAIIFKKLNKIVHKINKIMVLMVTIKE